MQQLRFSFEVLTPLFQGGADARQNPELLRAASFRGALRYWFRAALGGAVSDTELRLYESTVFGDTQRASAITIRLVRESEIHIQTYEKQSSIRKSGGSHPMPTGRDYLYWSMAKSGSSEAGNYLPAREFIEPGSRFTLILSSRLGASRVEQTLRDAIYSLWLLVQLGGLGSRSRRCAGSLATLPMGSALTQQLDVPFAQQATPQQLKIVLEQGIRTIRHNLAKGWNNPQQSLPPMFDIITPECCQIWVVKGARAWQTADQAVEGIGAALRDFRSSDAQGKSDHDSVLNWFANPKLAPALKRVAFGLPIPFRYSDGGPRDVLEGSEHERRSSPLHMRVSRLSQEYVGVLTLFKSQFLEKGKPPHSKDERIALRNKKLTASPPADYRFIEKFVVEQFDALEVKFQ